MILVPRHDLSPNLRDITPFRPAEPEPLRQFHEEVEREEERVREELIEAEARRGVVKTESKRRASRQFGGGSSQRAFYRYNGVNPTQRRIR